MGNEWDNSSVGDGSVAFGYRNIASGTQSFAMGDNNQARGQWTFAMGWGNELTTDADNSFAFGQDNLVTTAMGGALGEDNRVGGGGYKWAFAIGNDNTVAMESGIAIGQHLVAGINNTNAMVIGSGASSSTPLVNDVEGSLMVGFNSDVPTLMVTQSAGSGTTGDVGIGTATPATKLEIAGAAGQQLRLTESASGESSDFSTDGSGTLHVRSNNGRVIFDNNVILEGLGDIDINDALIPFEDNSHNLGNTMNAWAEVFAYFLESRPGVDLTLIPGKNLLLLPDESNHLVGIGTTTPDPSAALDIVSSSRGLLPPRLTTAQRDAIPAPAAGLIIFNTDTRKHEAYDGTAWGSLGGT